MDSTEESSPQRVHCRHCGDLHPASFQHCPKTGRSLTTGRALVGRVIAARYRVLAMIGEGGMGAVYVAEHLGIGRKVALKRLHPELTADDKAVARFQREARAAAATGHEHIVEVLDLGYAEDGAPFLVMEYLRGRSLAQLLRAEGRLAPARACRMMGQVLAALAAVHERGIVHRDLKPDNILLTRRGGDAEFVKVLDFGISKMRPEEGEATLDLTRTGVMLGTPFYMSPEQARGMKELDHRVDLFAAGVILYETLGGQLPFDGENYHQLLQAILSGEHARIDELRPELDPALSAVVEKAIARSPDERFQTARDMLEALRPHGAEEPAKADPASEPRPTAASLGLATPPPLVRTTRSGSRGAAAATTPAPALARGATASAGHRFSRPGMPRPASTGER
ncbi:MAG TPA: serine/threonine-protein kinase, partial [Sandaracinaceae bacterium LLY-WYZ-13_1]|nr:serine/threonine-protein kinase [Sandaracinaceae bacterium LLY-WYZ-13_1]